MIRRFNNGGATGGATNVGGITVPPDPLAGKTTSAESNLSTWAGPYVTEMLGRGRALADMPYQTYGGPLTAGQSNLQNTAFSGLSNLIIPTDQMKAFTPGSFTDTGTASKYMNPYLSAALQPQIDEMNRQADIRRMENASRMSRAGAYGGGRQAILEGELERGLGANVARTLGEGYRQAFEQGQNQFNTEQQRQMMANQAAQQYGLAALQKQADLGGTQRDIEQQGITADYEQFREQRDYPYKQVQYMQSLLQGLPLQAYNYGYQQSSPLSELLGGTGGILGLLDAIFKQDK